MGLSRCKVLINSVYHSAITATNPIILLMKDQIRICRNSLEKCVNCVQNSGRNFTHIAFSRECLAMVKARADEETEISNLKYGVPQGKILGHVLFIIYTLSLQYMLDYYNVSYNFYADDTQLYFKLDSRDQWVSKLKSVINAVQT